METSKSSRMTLTQRNGPIFVLTDWISSSSTNKIQRRGKADSAETLTRTMTSSSDESSGIRSLVVDSSKLSCVDEVQRRKSAKNRRKSETKSDKWTEKALGPYKYGLNSYFPTMPELLRLWSYRLYRMKRSKIINLQKLWETSAKTFHFLSITYELL